MLAGEMHGMDTEDLLKWPMCCSCPCVMLFGYHSYNKLTVFVIFRECDAKPFVW